MLEKLRIKLASINWGEESQSKILVVDDEKQITELLKSLLEDEGYAVEVAYNGREAQELVKKEHPDLIISDVTMPEVDGFDLCRSIKENEDTRLIPVMLVTALTGTRDKIKGIDAGADDFIGKPFNALELTTRVRSLIRVKNLNSQLENIDQIIIAFSAAVDARDPYTRGHSERVGMYGIKFAEALGLDENYQQMLFKGAILHDIGKIGIRDSVLLKKGKLTRDEYEIIKKHPAIGMKICTPLRTSQSLLNIVAYHHERMDGTGYPYGLIAEEIPIEGRIIGITDVFDALTSARPYRRALTRLEACEVLEEEGENHFDIDLLAVFLKAAIKDRFNSILEEAQKEQTLLDSQESTDEELVQEVNSIDQNIVGK